MNAVFVVVDDDFSIPLLVLSKSKLSGKIFDNNSLSSSKDVVWMIVTEDTSIILYLSLSLSLFKVLFFILIFCLSTVSTTLFFILCSFYFEYMK